MPSASNSRRSAYVALLILTIVLGLVLRRVPMGLPYVIVKYGGSMLWAAMVYWVVALLAPAWSALTTAIFAAVVAALVEFFKLYHESVLDAFRRTLAGQLLLGRYFSWWDIVAYLVAIALVYRLDRGFVRRGGA
ncbi:ribosomal maturation YjgA family protein [Granulicella aggregans]|uniref:ribosomal maturation YjgA family protein n=1 Tax=Granulicella aggregans TaxID=474949 RepID=UPI0021DFDDA8|nr:DUF2809 domain-containing protein [Granulicella aggregans]